MAFMPPFIVEAQHPKPNSWVPAHPVGQSRLRPRSRTMTVRITSRKGDAVLLSRNEYDALEETAHLLRVPANAKWLLESLQQASAGNFHEHGLVE